MLKVEKFWEMTYPVRNNKKVMSTSRFYSKIGQVPSDDLEKIREGFLKLFSKKCSPSEKGWAAIAEYDSIIANCGENARVQKISSCLRLKIFSYLRDKYDVHEAYYFVGAFNPKRKKLYASLKDADYEVIFREHAETALSKKKGNVDPDIKKKIIYKK